MAEQFRDGFYSLCPPWLRTGNAERYLYTLELMRDLLMEKANQAIKIRLPGQGHESQIPFLAFDRQLVQGPNESKASFILRLQGAFPTWNEAGSAASVLGQLHAYAQGYQSVTLPQFVIVSNLRTLEDASQVNSWYTLNYDDPIGTEPLLSTVPGNFDWDTEPKTWRNWLVIYQYLDDPTLSGAAASISTAEGGSFILDDWGEEVDGVWVPKQTGTALNAPFLEVNGLAGVPDDAVGSMLTLSGSVNPENNGTFQIVRVISSTTVVIANVDGVPSDAGPLDWEIASYPWMPPALALGTPGTVWGEGEGTPPDVDIGSNVGGLWQPTTFGATGETPDFAWGVRVNPLEIVTIRGLVRTWKSAGTYYPNIIICYDGPDGAYSRTSSGFGNPDGSFGPVGAFDDGVWVPTRLLASRFNCYCQGTGRAVACGIENIT